jgi:hypothetical protein
MKHIKSFDKLYESLIEDKAKEYTDENCILIGSNQSTWSWEYDIDNVYAFLFMNKENGDLTLKFLKEHIKTGIGAGTRKNIIEIASVGTITKPAKAEIISLLKKHGHEKSRAGYNFKRDGWSLFGSDEGNLTLNEILTNEKVLRIAKIKSILNDDETIEEKPTSKYNPERNAKLSAIHKKLYMLSDDEIDILYNKINR